VHGKLPLRPQPEADRVDAATTRHGEIIVLVGTLAAARRKPSAAPRAMSNCQATTALGTTPNMFRVRVRRKPSGVRAFNGGPTLEVDSAPGREDATIARSGVP
jgi:hypothetical protein